MRSAAAKPLRIPVLMAAVFTVPISRHSEIESPKPAKNVPNAGNLLASEPHRRYAFGLVKDKRHCGSTAR